MSINFNTPRLTEISIRFPVGSRVRFYPIAGEPNFEEAHIRSEPWVLGHGEIVIAITGRAGGVHVGHLEQAPSP